jgi:hypothetical protein
MMKKILLVLSILFVASGEVNSLNPEISPFRESDSRMSGTMLSESGMQKLKKPGSAKKAQKKAAKKKQQQKKDWNKYVKKSQQRSYDIQSPEVQSRMKQNKKDTQAHNKAKKNHSRKSTKNAAKKYN